MAFDTLTGNREMTAPIVTKNPSERIVEGPVLVPQEEDMAGDTATEEEIREWAHKFLKDYRNIDLMHTMNNVAVPVESWISDFDRTVTIQNAGREEDIIIPSGSWWLSSYVESDEAWQAVLEGELNGYSIMAVQEHVSKQFQPTEDREELISQIQTAAKSGMITKKDIRTVNLDELGDSVVVNAVSLVDVPEVPKAMFTSVKSLSERLKNDFVNVSAKARDTVRSPSDIEWDGLDDEGDPDWEETPKNLNDVYKAWYDQVEDADEFMDPSEIDSTDETPQQFKDWVADGSLIGDATESEWEDIRAFPVVNYENYNLHEGGLKAANRLAPTASIPEGLAEEIQDTVTTLLEDEFDMNQDGETTQQSEGNQVSDATFKALEGTLDEKLKTRREAVEEAIEMQMAEQVGEDSNVYVWIKGLFEDRAVFELDAPGDEIHMDLFQIGYSYDPNDEEASLSGNPQPVDIQEVLVPVTKAHYDDLRAQVLKESAEAARIIDQYEQDGMTQKSARFIQRFAAKNGIRPNGSLGFPVNSVASESEGEFSELIEQYNESTGLTQKGGDESMDEEEVREIVQEEMEGVAEDAATKAAEETAQFFEELEEDEDPEASEKSGEGEEDVTSEILTRLDELEEQVNAAEKRATGSRQPVGQDSQATTKSGDDEDEDDEIGVERGPNGVSRNKVFG